MLLVLLCGTSVARASCLIHFSIMPAIVHQNQVLLILNQPCFIQEAIPVSLPLTRPTAHERLNSKVNAS